MTQYIIQNRNVQISVLNGVLWDRRQVHCAICEIGLLFLPKSYIIVLDPHNGHHNLVKLSDKIFKVNEKAISEYELV